MLYLLIFLLVSCGQKPDIGGSYGSEGSYRHDELRAKRQLYRDLAASLQHPEHGWIHHDNCDGLMYEGMLKFSGMNVDIEAARDDKGMWHRTPDHGCFPEGRSRSTISRDMIAGWLFASTKEMRLELYELAKNNSFKIGEGPFDTIHLTPNFMNTLAITVGKGKVMEEIWIDPIKSHQRSVVTLNALFRNLHSNTGLKDSVMVVNEFHKKDPANMLFYYFLARHGIKPMEHVIDVLMDSPWFPNDRLPESKDRCATWVWEKDHNREPCPQAGKVLSGGDFMFLATHILGDYQR